MPAEIVGMRLFKIADSSGSMLAEMPVEVERYGERTWAVYAGGELLCVTVYLRGARAVQALVERLQDELRQARIGEPSMAMPGEGFTQIDAGAVEAVG